MQICCRFGDRSKGGAEVVIRSTARSYPTSRSRVGWAALGLALAAPAAWSQHPYASAVVSYDPGVGVNPAYTNPQVAIGEPSRFTPDPLFPGAVTPFQSPYLPSQVVQIAPGGSLVVEFDPPIVDDPRHPFGIDLLVFGNSFFIDAAFPNGVVGGLFSDGGIVEVSADGVLFQPIKGVEADGLFPTMGYLDGGPFPTTPGSEPTNFRRPVDPVAAIALLGATYGEVLDLYDGSGGGAPIDIASAGLESVRFVRIRVPADATASVEIDAFAAVAPLGPDADLNGDGVVDGADLGILLSAWGPCPAKGACPADLDGNGSVGGADLAVLLSAWTG